MKEPAEVETSFADVTVGGKRFLSSEELRQKAEEEKGQTVWRIRPDQGPCSSLMEDEEGKTIGLHFFE